MIGINITWKWHHNGFSSKSNFCLWRHFLWKCGYSFMLRLRQIDLVFHITVIECPFSCIPMYTLYTLYTHVYPVYPCIPCIPCIYMGIQGIQGDKQSITITWRIYLFGVSVTWKNNRKCATLGPRLLLCEVSQKSTRGISKFLWISTKRV